MSGNTPTQRLSDMGVNLSREGVDPAKPQPSVRSGNLVFTSGRTSTTRGKVGSDAVTLEHGRAAAREAAIRALAAAQEAVVNLDGVRRIVKMTGFVNCAPGFVNTSSVIDGASEFLQAVFEDKGSHARSAVGVFALPQDAAVEVELILEVE